MLVSKIIVKDEKFKDCPLCGAKIELIFKEQTDTETSELDLIKEEDWLLP
ncbi:MAG: hypothetical protein ACFFDN_21020 [Candidatus Hodarchaeota archaeon]